MIFVNQYWVLEFFFLDCIQFFDFFLSYSNFIWMIWHGKKVYGLSTQSILKEYVQIILFPNGYIIWTDNTVHKITHMHSVARKQSRFNSQNALTLWLPNKIAFYCYGKGVFLGLNGTQAKKRVHTYDTNILVLMYSSIICFSLAIVFVYFPSNTYSSRINISMLLLHFVNNMTPDYNRNIW